MSSGRPSLCGRWSLPCSRVVLFYGAIALYNQYRIQESSIGQAVQIASSNTNDANMYLFGVVACIAAAGLLIWNTVYHWKAAERLDDDRTT